MQEPTKTWSALKGAMGDSIEGLDLFEAVSLLISQRENARNSAEAHKAEVEELSAALERAVSIIEDIPYPGNYAAAEMRKLLAKVNGGQR